MPLTANRPVLSVERLSIEFGARRVVDDVSFRLQAGKTLCIAGESGSGKSLTSLAIMGLLPDAARIPGGAILFGDTDLLSLNERQMQPLRGRQIGMIFQEPMTSLNPLMTIGRQLEETLQRHETLGRRERRARVKTMLDAVRLAQVEKRLGQYPHELSGGMRQRVMIAMAMLCQPKVLIADEPTTALDVTIQAQILELMRELQRDFATSILMITHDMGVVAEMADEVVVMNQGRIEEQAPVGPLFSAPQADYTKRLLAAVPVLGAAPAIEPVAVAQPLLSVRDLSVRFPLRREIFRPRREVFAVDGVSFDLFPGETLGIVGESGCGKSTTGKALMNMVPFSGSALLAGQQLNGLRGEALQAVRRDIQMVFQDPYAALNPRRSIFELVGEPLLIHQQQSLAQRRERVATLLEQVGLPAAAMRRYPHQFSGGQRQRICIARALALNPKLIIADESVSALDVSVQAQVLELLETLRHDYDLSYLFISHDMAVVERICHRVAVMFGGRIVEIGPRDRVLHHARHPYTQRLLSAVPMPDVTRKRDFGNLLNEMERPDPIKPFGWQSPPQRFTDYGGGHFAAA
ncbi:ABC transporter ATP-binding protein [Affinibrenneria salicis]|uniref:Glutathione import ATP-binding protein GsiA n=1 Tax=Affinibrenneria salicis TaxID=2590031 RepID=A0A5J5FZ46_9GAMM|nr:ABC transporter ATP-binding protein [Affinibrenneria salicis]KAA8999379.1 ABC transporter ATP-binding protein [Affinibrenneria salicis]